MYGGGSGLEVPRTGVRLTLTGAQAGMEFLNPLGTCSKKYATGAGTTF